MKKYFLLISSSLIFMNAAHAMTAEQQLGMMKDMYIKEFQKMDTNKDGQVNQNEYLRFQFENFRANIIQADGFDDVDGDSAKPEQSDETSITTSPTESLDNAISAIEEMANFKLDDEEDGLYEEKPAVKVTEADSQKLTLEDVMPEDEVSFVTIDDDSLTEMLDNNKSPAAEKTEKKPSKEDEISALVEKIRKTLPKRIDEITTWTNIVYKDEMIQYIYTADLEINKLSSDEKKILEESIKNETCINAYKEMCPKVKPTFIDNGIDMRINYLDKNKQQFSYCEFNEKTCE